MHVGWDIGDEIRCCRRTGSEQPEMGVAPPYVRPSLAHHLQENISGTIQGLPARLLHRQRNIPSSRWALLS